MSKLEEIERSVEQLSPDDLARFRAWFQEFQARQFDEAIERDANSGRLDSLAAEALAEHRAGLSRKLPR